MFYKNFKFYKKRNYFGSTKNVIAIYSQKVDPLNWTIYNDKSTEFVPLGLLSLLLNVYFTNLV